MEHKTHWGIVFSDVVSRAVQALDQYKLVSGQWPPTQRFEATLTLSVAQTALSAAWELQSALKQQESDLSPDLAELRDLIFLEDTTYLSRDQEDATLSLHELGGTEVLEHLRNSLSHPVPCSPGGELPLTGYLSVPDDGGQISRFMFVDSPWVDLQQGRRNTGKAVIKYPYRMRLAKSDDKASRQRGEIERSLKKFQRDGDPHGRLNVHEAEGHVFVSLDAEGRPYIPFMRLSTSVDDLAKICRLLAENYEGWLKSLEPATLADARTRPLHVAGPST
ncbi:MAG: hypothetical protein ACTHNS_09390 [Marmoricola sp.]